jgi:hypothetical protein
MKNSQLKKFGLFALIGAGILLLIKKMDISSKIIDFGKKWVGVNDIGNNIGFSNPVFTALMKSVGWEPGYEWCMYFVKLVFTTAYKDNSIVLQSINKLFNGSSQQSFNNVLKSRDGIFKAITIGAPQVNDIVIYVHTNNRAAGHAGVVLKVNDNNTIETLEGNTGAKSQSNGELVAYKTRTSIIGKSIGGDLVVRGFIRKV